MSGKDYLDPAALDIVTMENAVYMGMKNDLAFVLEMGLYLYEHQSTYNPNLLRNEDGRIFSRLLELHLIELNKVLTGQTIDEWIRFFNAKTQEDLDMLKSQTKSAGILEAIKEIEHMSLTRYARMRYDEHLKKIMDRKAQDAYVYDQGHQVGRKEGREEGREEGRQEERRSMVELISRMNAGEDADKITQLKDPDVLEAMMKKYGIE